MNVFLLVSERGQGSPMTVTHELNNLRGQYLVGS